VVLGENDGCQAVTIPESEDALSMPSSHVLLDQVDIAFDDEHAVIWAGLLLSATLAERLGRLPRKVSGSC
jgi:hypothetical protein